MPSVGSYDRERTAVGTSTNFGSSSRINGHMPYTRLNHTR